MYWKVHSSFLFTVILSHRFNFSVCQLFYSNSQFLDTSKLFTPSFNILSTLYLAQFTPWKSPNVIYKSISSHDNENYDRIDLQSRHQNFGQNEQLLSCPMQTLLMSIINASPPTKLPVQNWLVIYPFPRITEKITSGFYFVMQPFTNGLLSYKKGDPPPSVNE